MRCSLVGLVLIAVALAAVWRVGRLGALHAGTFLGMFSESVLYAMLLGPLALAPITGELKFGGFSPHLAGLPLKLVVAAGAGFYEEAFFRFAILGAVFYLAKEVGKLRPFTAGALALVAQRRLLQRGAFPGRQRDAGSRDFIYRLAAGMILGLVFLTRGFGIAAWTTRSTTSTSSASRRVEHTASSADCADLRRSRPRPLSAFRAALSPPDNKPLYRTAVYCRAI